MQRLFDRPAVRTTAAEITRNFGHWQDKAMREPILITHHGRPRLVLQSAEAFERGQSAPAAIEVGDRPPPDDVRRDLETILSQIFEGYIVFDHELRIRSLNAAALVNSTFTAEDVVGVAVDDPRLGEVGALIGSRLRRVLRTGETMQFEVPGVFNRHRRYDLKAFAVRGGVGVTINQLTELYDLRSEREARAGFDQALAGLPNLMLFGLSPMGFVTAPNPAMCELLGFSADHLATGRLIDFVIPAQRHELSEQLNEVLQGRAGEHVAAVRLLTNAQDEVPVSLSIARDMRGGACHGLSVAGVRLGGG